MEEELTLYPHQKIGLAWLISRSKGPSKGGILADDMGLGKTIQTISLIKWLWDKRDPAAPSNQAYLFVLPLSVLHQWQKEFKRVGFEAKLFYGKGRSMSKMRDDYHSTPRELRTEPFIVLTTYNLLGDTFKNHPDDKLFSIHYRMVICDEAHEMKELKTQKAKAFVALSKNTTIFLTGTPIQNRISEFVNLLFLITNDKGIRKLSGSNDIRTLRRIRALRDTYLLRRTKEEVGRQSHRLGHNPISELSPVKMFTRRVPFKDSEKPLYKQHWDEFIIGIKEFFKKEKDSITMLAAISSLRRQCVHPLLGMNKEGESQKPALKQYVDNVHDKEYPVMPPSAKITRVFADLMAILRADETNKILVFSQWTGALNVIEYYLKRMDFKFLRLDGKTSKGQRQSQIDSFQNNPRDRIFLISIKAGGLGLNLTAANHVLLVDPYWNAAIESQAIDRANRMGQKRVVTVIRYLIEDEDSIEKAMEELQKNKLEHVNSVTGKDLRKTDLPELRLFLKHIKKKQEAARLARMPPKTKRMKR